METTASIGNVVIQEQRKFIPGVHIIMTGNTATVRWEQMVIDGEEIKLHQCL